MNHLRPLVCVVGLTLALSLSCFVQAQSCNPGETHGGPPCSAAQPTTDDSTAPGETQSPPAAESVDIVTAFEDALIALLIF
jgi:hypothetical protein